jgi:hypothetical protein
MESLIKLFKELWAKIPSSWKYETLSLLHTFLAGFIAEIAINLANLGYQIEWSTAFLAALVLAGVRGGVKASVLLLSKLMGFSLPTKQ